MSLVPPLQVSLSGSILLGRQIELTAVAQLLQSGVRHVTLTGPGGVGKTMLAQAVVNQLETSALPVYRMYLAAVAQGQGLAAEIARSLGLLEQAMSPLEVLKLHFEGQRAVLLLDNLEQMHGADEAVCSFLEACPSVQVLVTSRRVLGTKMERVWSVQPFEVPEPQMTLEALVAMPAVALFVQCAQARAAGFQVRGQDTEIITELVRRLDGLPLALELVGRRAALFDPAALLTQVQAQLPGGGASDAPERHRSLREVARWSVELLPRSLQAFFYRLSVFPGIFTAEKAQQVTRCAVEGVDALGALIELTEHHLVVPLPDGRFRLLETLRAYGREQLEVRQETWVLLERLGREAATDCARLALSGGGARVGDLHLAQDRLFAVVQWVLAQEEAQVHWLDQAADLCAQTHPTWFLGGRTAQGWSCCTQLLRQPLLSARARTQIEWISGVLAPILGQPTEAEAFLSSALRRAEQLEDLELMVGVLLAQVDQLLYVEMPVQALEKLEVVWPMVRQLQHPVRDIEALRLWGAALSETRQWEEAQAHLHEALGLSRAAQRSFDQMKILGLLAGVHDQSGRPDLARPQYEAALDLARQLGASRDEAVISGNLGLMLLDLQQAEAALTHFQFSEQGFQTAHDLLSVAHARQHQGVALMQLGRLEEAESVMLDAAGIYARLQLPACVAAGRANLSRIQLAQGRWHDGWQTVQQVWPVLYETAQWGYALLALSVAVRVMAHSQQARPLALLLGAAHQLSTTYRLPEIFEVEESLGSVREAGEQLLGALAFQQAWSQGEAAGPSGIAEILASTCAAPPVSSCEPTSEFTRRELDVLRLVSDGLTNRAIGQRLGLNETTVRGYLVTAFSKLGVTNRTQAARKAAEQGLL